MTKPDINLMAYFSHFKTSGRSNLKRIMLACAFSLPALAQTPVSNPPPSATSPEPTSRAWEFRDGRWSEVEEPTPTPATDELLDRAESTLQRGAAGPARKLLLRWFKDPLNKQSPLRDRATFLLAEAYFQLGNRILAFYHYDEVMDLYADGRFYAPSLQRQYDIAEAFLQGYKRRFLKLPILPADDEAIEMLFRIQTRSPGSPLAEKALLRTADYYYATRQYDLAADAYLAYANSYPRSPLVPQTKLRQAYSTQAQFRGTRFDATTLVDARQQLSELSVLQPQIAEEENLPNVIERIDAALARKLDQTADYYRRTKQPAASAYTLFVLQDSYPDSPEAQDIPVKLQKLPADAVERARAVYFESGPNPADSLEPLIPTGLNTNTPTQTPAPATRQENP